MTKFPTIFVDPEHIISGVIYLLGGTRDTVAFNAYANNGNVCIYDDAKCSKEVVLSNPNNCCSPVGNLFY